MFSELTRIEQKEYTKHTKHLKKLNDDVRVNFHHIQTKETFREDITCGEDSKAIPESVQLKVVEALQKGNFTFLKKYGISKDNMHCYAPESLKNNCVILLF
jgi:hypothetical protein